MLALVLLGQSRVLDHGPQYGASWLATTTTMVTAGGHRVIRHHLRRRGPAVTSGRGICGLTVTMNDTAITLERGGVDGFCSIHCGAIFAVRPTGATVSAATMGDRADRPGRLGADPHSAGHAVWR